MTHMAADVIRSYKKNDPVMVKKYVSVKDVAYRKGSPERELWHAELTGEHDFYLMTILAVALVILLYAVCKRASHFLCRMADR